MDTSDDTLHVTLEDEPDQAPPAGNRPADAVDPARGARRRSPGPDHAGPAPRHSRLASRRRIMAGVLGLLLLLVACTVSGLHFRSPAAQSRRFYRAGRGCQARGHFTLARRHYAAALRRDPRMALAALATGTTYLLVTDPSMPLTLPPRQDGMVGRDLQAAETWLQHALRLTEQMDPRKPLPDPWIATWPDLRAFCHLYLALTAQERAVLLRAQHAEAAAASWDEVAARERWAAATASPRGATQSEQIRTIRQMWPEGPLTAPWRYMRDALSGRDQERQ